MITENQRPLAFIGYQLMNISVIKKPRRIFQHNGAYLSNRPGLYCYVEDRDLCSRLPTCLSAGRLPTPGYIFGAAASISGDTPSAYFSKFLINKPARYFAFSS
jgi:hypothetical protein